MKTSLLFHPSKKFYQGNSQMIFFLLKNNKHTILLLRHKMSYVYTFL